MPSSRVKGALMCAGLIAACAVPEHGHAALGDRFPADAYGVVRDAEIDALATSIAGRPYRIECTVPFEESQGRTWFTGLGSEGSSVTWYGQADVSQVNGDQCGALDHLLHWDAGYFHHDEVMVEDIRPISKPAKKKRRAPVSYSIWASTRTAAAGSALLTLQHEVTHGVLSTGGFEDDGDQANGQPAAFDEGLVECTAWRNIWNTIKGLPGPGWFKRNLYAAARDAHEASAEVERTVC